MCHPSVVDKPDNRRIKPSPSPQNWSAGLRESDSIHWLKLIPWNTSQISGAKVLWSYVSMGEIHSQMDV